MNMIRFGLVCLFSQQPITFKRTTATYLKKFSRSEQLQKIAAICFHNAKSLKQALEYCHQNGIGSFRVNSQILPLKTHPQVGYEAENLPNGKDVIQALIDCGTIAKKNNIRMLFHPDQFVVLSSPDKQVVENSLREIEYQAEISEWINADVINIHGGGRYESKTEALKRFTNHFLQLSASAKKRLTIENDDVVYTPSDLLPLCRELSIPFVYDVHHHRCLKDELTIEEATDLAIATWNREPLFHISSPKYGWQEKKCRSHNDFIHFEDVPPYWKNLHFTLEIEAKAKEMAVLKLKETWEKEWIL
jgi:UV DNA damage endonuclease